MSAPRVTLLPVPVAVGGENPTGKRQTASLVKLEHRTVQMHAKLKCVPHAT